MSTLSSSCRNCGAPKAIQNFADMYCPECATVKIEAEKNAPEGTSESDRIRLGKTALSHRATHAFSGWRSPRTFDPAIRHGS
jgi:uncharacterized Zn finger protein (UPF0148 family)